MFRGTPWETLKILWMSLLEWPNLEKGSFLMGFDTAQGFISVNYMLMRVVVSDE